MTRLATFVLATLLAACGGGQPSSSPNATGGGAEGLIDVLSSKTDVREAGAFETSPLSGRGVLLCVGREEVRVYEFSSGSQRDAAARQIDPADPSKIGTSIVEWTGNPRFWVGDRIIVLYLGSDAATEALLTAALGAPFARGASGGLGGIGGNACVGASPSS